MRLAALAFLLLLAALVVLANAGRLPEPILVLYRLPAGDELGHFGLAAVGAYLLERVVRTKERLASLLPGAAALALALTLSVEELSQVFSVQRVFDPLDLAATWVGAVVGFGCAERQRLSEVSSELPSESDSSRSADPKRISPR